MQDMITSWAWSMVGHPWVLLLIVIAYPIVLISLVVWLVRDFMGKHDK